MPSLSHSDVLMCLSFLQNHKISLGLASLESFISRGNKDHPGCSKTLTAPLSVPGSGLTGTGESGAPLDEEAQGQEGGWQPLVPKREDKKHLGVNARQALFASFSFVPSFLFFLLVQSSET